MMTKKKQKARRVPPSEVRERCDVRDVLDRLGFEYEDKGDELLALCPNPDHDDENVGSWSIHAEEGDERNGRSHCFSCGWDGDVFSVVQIVKRCGFADALDFVTGGVVLEDAGQESEDPRVYWKNLKKWKPPGVALPPGCSEIRPGSAAKEYLQRRWFGDEVIQREGLLDWRTKKRILVPVRMWGMLVTWVARSYVDEKPRVLMPPGVEVGSGSRWAIMGYDAAVQGGELNVAEGWADKSRLSQSGLAGALALCGSELTDERVLAIMALRPSKIIHWADGDAAGRRLAQDMASAFGSRVEFEVVQFAEGVDVGSIKPKDVRSMKPVAWRDHKLHGSK